MTTKIELVIRCLEEALNIMDATKNDPLFELGKIVDEAYSRALDLRD